MLLLDFLHREVHLVLEVQIGFAHERAKPLLCHEILVAYELHEAERLATVQQKLPELLHVVLEQLPPVRLAGRSVLRHLVVHSLQKPFLPGIIKPNA